jgi:anti-sigma regulatory factor (Ser/Thr protein kinase)
MQCHARTFPMEPTTAREARAWTRALLFDTTPADVVHDAQVVVSEMVTNSLRHSTGPTLRLDVAVSPVSLYVECVDGGGPTEPRIPDADPLAEGGRGLHLIAGLASVSGPLECGGRYFAFLGWADPARR